ncbi:MAG: hypothetical protein MH204_06540 [Fimbriimonadaceae bacterium]|nr:hypothetical protein [Fimbriimonadaceae bacterium]
MKKELLDKLMAEEALTAAEMLELEEALESQESAGVAWLAGRLPDEEPSLEWRSRLNQRLADHAPAPARRRPVWHWLAPLGAAACLGAALVFAPRFPEGPAPTARFDESEMVASGLEDAMVAAYTAVSAAESVGVSYPDARRTSVAPTYFDWSQLEGR